MEFMLEMPPNDSGLDPFPEHLLQSEDEKQALLTHLACSDAMTYMYELGRKLLDGKKIKWFLVKVPVLTCSCRNNELDRRDQDCGGCFGASDGRLEGPKYPAENG